MSPDWSNHPAQRQKMPNFLLQACKYLKLNKKNAYVDHSEYLGQKVFMAMEKL